MSKEQLDIDKLLIDLIAFARKQDAANGMRVRDEIKQAIKTHTAEMVSKAIDMARESEQIHPEILDWKQKYTPEQILEALLGDEK